MRKLILEIMMMTCCAAFAATPPPLQGWTPEQIEQARTWIAEHPNATARQVRDWLHQPVQTGTILATTAPRDPATAFRRSVLRTVYDVALSGLTNQQMLDPSAVRTALESWLTGANVAAQRRWAATGAVFWDEYWTFRAAPQAWLAEDDDVVTVPARPITQPRWQRIGLPRPPTLYDMEALVEP